MLFFKNNMQSDKILLKKTTLHCIRSPVTMCRHLNADPEMSNLEKNTEGKQ